MAIDIAGDAPLPGGLNPLATVALPAAGDTDTVSNGVSELPPAPSPASSSGPAATTGAPGEGTVVNVTFDPAGGDGAGAADGLGIDDLVAIATHAGATGRNDGQDPLGPQGDELPLDLTDLDLETLMGISIGGVGTVTDIAFYDDEAHGGGAKFGIFDLVSSATGLGVQVTLASFDVNDAGSGSLLPAMDLNLFTDTTVDSDTAGGADTDTTSSPIITGTADTTGTAGPVNNTPVAAADGAATAEDTVLNIPDAGVLANDTDPDVSDVLTVTAFDAVSAKGAAVHLNAGGGYIYNPTASAVLNALAAGETTDDSFTYTVSDGHGGAAKAKVKVTITGVNDAPVAADDAAATDVDTPVTIAVLANDTDVDGDGLSIAAVSQGANGSVTVNADNSITFTPEAGFTGLDSFTYSVADGNGGGDTGAVTVTVANLIEGGPGDDTLNGTKGEDTIFGYGGDDTISGRNGDDTLYGGDGYDTLNGQGGSDTLFGGAGDDILIWDSLDATIDGGGGTDTLDARGADIDITAFGGVITGIEVIDLSKPGADTLTLSAQDILDMSDSNTVTVTGGSPDTVEAGTGWTDAGFDGSGNHIYTQDIGGTLATLLLDPDIAPNADIIA
ncbi:MAG: cadherin-like domain-containing protein [Proteobacteria bacterium]|nr:cadherin-like domain-containing protein [Pseudomonadota bacterium]